jgi:coniferyl-aldehyde dehydrogenase
MTALADLASGSNGNANTEHAANIPRAGGSGPADLGATLARLRDAFRKRGAPSYDARIEDLEKLEKAIKTRKQAMVDAIARDFGTRTKYETLFGEVFAVLGLIQYSKDHLREWMEPEDRETSWVFLPSTSEVVVQPLGVVGIIAPWNYPVRLALAPLVAAIAAGNRVMLKPSELVPETSALLHDIVAATFPADQVTVVTGGTDVGEAFSKLAFDHLFFTGSTRVGKIIMRAAADNLVPVTLELGGKSPAVVAPDYDVHAAATRVAAGKLYNAGQTCIAPDYVMVPAAKRDAFVEAYRAAVAKMYPTLLKNPDYTSIVNDKHYARLRGYLDDAKASGAEVVEINPTGEALGGDAGAAGGRKMAPTIVLGATDKMACMQEEIFGPVLPVLTYGTLEEAIGYVNDHPRPLALYYFSHDRDGVDKVLAETTSGGVTVNETMLHIMQDDMPFGGVGPSGIGAYHARDGFDAFSHRKAVYRQSRISTRGFLLPPYGKMAERILTLLVGR